MDAKAKSTATASKSGKRSTAKSKKTPERSQSPVAEQASADARPRSRNSADALAQGNRKPRGHDEVVKSLVDATLSLWSEQGTADLSLRSIAKRAGVTYGLVHRHIGSKEAVISAAMERVIATSLTYFEDTHDIEAVVDVMAPAPGVNVRLVAWSMLQYVYEDVFPEENAFLQRLCSIAEGDVDEGDTDAQNLAKVRTGSLLAMFYGWRLFGPYLISGLKLDELPKHELDDLIRDRMLRVVAR